MADEDGDGSAAAAPEVKRCFVVSEFGRDPETRLARNQALKHLVRKVLEPMGYEVKRADEISDVGQITHQIIERLLDVELVVADLTGGNPNVYYELAVRHAARKPVITLMTDGNDIPFDLKDVRTVFYDLHNPDRLEAAQEELRLLATALEKSDDPVRNPITVARDVALLSRSDDPDARAVGQALSAINELRDEVRSLAQAGSERPRPGRPSADRVVRNVDLKKMTAVLTDQAVPINDLAAEAGIPVDRAYRILTSLEANGLAYGAPDEGWRLR